MCRELVPAEYEVERAFKDKVNFVMLNVDNTKWAPEVRGHTRTRCLRFHPQAYAGCL